VADLTAASLPGGSVVVDDLKGTAFYAAGDPGTENRWSEALTERADSTVDYALRHGAHVVRVGDAYPPAPMLAPDARERLARHLFLSERTDEWAPREWDMPQHVNQEPYLRRADAMLAVITGQEK